MFECCLSVCLSLGLLATLLKTLRTDCNENFMEGSDVVKEISG